MFFWYHFFAADQTKQPSLATGSASGSALLHVDLAQLQAQSTGEDSNSSDTAASDHGDMDAMELNGSLDSMQQRHFAGGFLGLQGIGGILPGPSGLHSADFGEFAFTNEYIYAFLLVALSRLESSCFGNGYE